MKLSKAKYLIAYVTPIVALLSIWMANEWSYFAVVLLFGILPIFELFSSGSTRNLTEEEEAEALADKTYDWLVYGFVPAQYIILGSFLYLIGGEGIPVYAKVGMTLAFGLACGILGINVAHELGHRNTWHEQLMSKMLLLTTLYMHFFIEHNRGHHKNVSTDQDPASSRYGEMVYSFYFRTIIGGWLSAWKLESERLKQTGKGFWTWHNEMLRFQIIQIAFVAAIYSFWGLPTLLWFLCGAIIGFLLLETVNYIEHYGLRRKKSGDRYERTLPIHSWNSNHPLGRIFLFELSRHSDHHFLANRKFQILRHFEESPQMPTGYPGMVLLSLVPPLWFLVMHRQIAKYRQTSEGLALA